jgi:hypothetical protein
MRDEINQNDHVDFDGDLHIFDSLKVCIIMPFHKGSLKRIVLFEELSLIRVDHKKNAE